MSVCSPGSWERSNSCSLEGGFAAPAFAVFFAAVLPPVLCRTSFQSPMRKPKLAPLLSCCSRWSRPCAGVAEQGIQDIEAVAAGVVGQPLAGQRGETGGEVDGADHLLGYAGLYAALPTRDEWRPGAAFEHAVLAAAIRTGGLVIAELFDCAVLVAVVQHRAVIRAEHDEGFLGQAETVERRHQLADGPVELQDGVAAKSQRGLALKPFVRHARDMDVVRGKEQEERPVPVLLDPADGLLDPLVGQLFVAETGLGAAGVEADAADAVVDRVVVAVGPVHPQQVPMRDAGRMILGGFLLPTHSGSAGSRPRTR